MKASPGSTDGMQKLIALLGTDEWPQDNASTSGSAEAELAKAFACISGLPAPNTMEAAQHMKALGQTIAEPEVQVLAEKTPAAEAEVNAEEGPAQDRAELMQGLTAEIAAAAQKAAQDAISSSVQVGSSTSSLLLGYCSGLHSGPNPFIYKRSSG